MSVALEAVQALLNNAIAERDKLQAAVTQSERVLVTRRKKLERTAALVRDLERDVAALKRAQTDLRVVV